MPHVRRCAYAALLLGLGLSLSLWLGATTAHGVLTPITVTVDGSAPGQNFDGDGTISAGGESRLVRDYTPSQLIPVFDYMFCSPLGTPSAGYCTSGRAGAAPAIFKVEIGGDTNSSVGAEPSFLGTRAEYNQFDYDVTHNGSATQIAQDCHLPLPGDDFTATGNKYWGRGYEWRLMREAYFRNNEILFYGLPWGAPGWIGGTASDGGYFYSSDMINYDLAFAYCAYLNGTPLSYLGIWNETLYNDGSGLPGHDYTSWIVDLHNALAGYINPDSNVDPNIQAAIRNIKVVAHDNYASPIADDISSDHDGLRTANAVYAIGTHYGQPGGDAGHPEYTPYQAALDDRSQYGVKLWTSEEGPLDFYTSIWHGAREMAERLNRYYITAGDTSVLMVGALAGFYDTLDQLPNPSNGMLYVNRPWSGYYDVVPAVWVMGHVGQFTQGPTQGADGTMTYRWRYIDSASCQDEPANVSNPATDTCADGSAPPGTFTGSYTTLRSISGTDWSTIIETAEASGSQSFSFCPTGGLATPNTANLWDTNLTDNAADSSYFVHQIVSLSGGCYALTLAAGHIYTLTTLTTGTRVLPNPPSDRPLCGASGVPAVCTSSDIDGGFDNSGYQLGDTPKYFTDIEGTFRIGCGSLTGESLCLSQVETRPTIQWGGENPNSWLGTVGTGGADGNNTNPLTLVGEYGGPSSPPGVSAITNGYSPSSTWWCHYSASVGVRINGDQWTGPPTNGAAGYAGLIVDYAPNPGGWSGWELRISNDNQLELYGNGQAVAGPVPIPSASGWHIIKMSIHEDTDTIYAYVDDVLELTYFAGNGNVTNENCGMVGLDTGWNAADFDLLDLRSGPYPGQ